MEELRWEEFDEEGVRDMVVLGFWLFLGAGVRGGFPFGTMIVVVCGSDDIPVALKK